MFEHPRGGGSTKRAAYRGAARTFPAPRDRQDSAKAQCRSRRKGRETGGRGPTGSIRAGLHPGFCFPRALSSHLFVRREGQAKSRRVPRVQRSTNLGPPCPLDPPDLRLAQPQTKSGGVLAFAVGIACGGPGLAIGCANSIQASLPTRATPKSGSWPARQTQLQQPAQLRASQCDFVVDRFDIASKPPPSAACRPSTNQDESLKYSL